MHTIDVPLHEIILHCVSCYLDSIATAMITILVTPQIAVPVFIVALFYYYTTVTIFSTYPTHLSPIHLYPVYLSLLILNIGSHR